RSRGLSHPYRYATKEPKYINDYLVEIRPENVGYDKIPKEYTALAV
ncbi:MAG: hypothetical protein ACI89U_003181, partial [Gammaproteobacteria bacterium]